MTEQNKSELDTATTARPNRKTWWVLLACALAVAAVSIYSYKTAAAEEAAAAWAPNLPATDEAAAPAAAVPAEPDAAPAASQLYIAPERQQLIGVKTATAELKTLQKEIRTTGRVAMDETRITHIHTKVSGYIEHVFVDYVGKAVRAGEPLFTIYSPDLVATQQEYLLALKSNAVLKDSAFPWIAGGSGSLLDAARQRLQLWDISAEEIDALERTGQVKRDLAIHSPVEGIVTERQAYHHGRYVTPDMDLYTMVDLSSVWVLGQVNEADIPFVRLNQPVQIELPYSSNQKKLQGRVAFIAPMLDAKTRSVEVRVEFANPDQALKPDMFVNFIVDVPLGRQVAIPADAVLDTGTQQYVFIDKGQGYFEPRTVKVGARTEDMAAIESGVKAGEQVVTAANFILDSESRLKGVLTNMGEPNVVSGAGSQAAAGAQTVQVEILEPKAPKMGTNTIRLFVKDAAGNPVTDAQLHVSLFMPQMGNMPPMSSEAALRPERPGIYRGSVEFLMAWTWDTTFTVKKNDKVIGTVKTTMTAR